MEATEEARIGEICETDYDLEAGELKIYYLNERKLQKCPHVKLHIGGHPVIAVVDSGSEATILAQELFDKLESRDAPQPNHRGCFDFSLGKPHQEN